MRRALFLVMMGLLVAACSGGGEPDIAAALHDDGITLSRDVVPAGDVALEATNDGTTIHEFEVFAVPEGVDGDALPVGDDAKVSDEGIELLDEVEDIAPGTSASLNLTLDAGTYVVICNLPGHYANGMHAMFSVT